METDFYDASLGADLQFTAEASGDGMPLVLETEQLVSLQFDEHAIQSLMSRRAPYKLVLGYTRTMMSFLLLQPAPARISMIGLGGGSLAKYCYHHLPDTKVVAIEIDPAVIALRDAFQIPPDDDRFEVVCADGVEYVKNQDARPDVILVDGFLACGMPAQLGTAEFYADCRARLADNGVLVANFLESDPDIGFYLDEVRTAFGESFSMWLSEDGGNYTLLAWKGKLPPQDTLLARATSLEATHALDLGSAARRLRQRKRPAPSRPSWSEQAS